MGIDYSIIVVIFVMSIAAVITFGKEDKTTKLLKENDKFRIKVRKGELEALKEELEEKLHNINEELDSLDNESSNT